MNETTEAKAEELRDLALTLVPTGALLKLIEEDFDAMDNSMGKAALKELNRRCDTLDRLLQKAHVHNYNAVGIMLADKAFMFSIGIMGAPEPAAAALAGTLFEAIARVEENLP
jgi:hypothetical protein